MAALITDEEILLIAETFADYEFDSGEKGLYYLCRGRQGKIDFVKGYVRLGLKSGWLYAYGDKHQGYICIRTDKSRDSFLGWISFAKGIISGMGFIGALRFIIDYKKAGKPIERFFKKDGYVHIKMLAVRKEYQGQGYMRKLTQMAFDLAEELNVPCIVSTDAESKAVKYEHLGFELYQKRKVSEYFCEYDMVRK